MKAFTHPLLWAAAVGSLLAGAPALHAADNDVDDLTAFQQTNLVANKPGVAQVTDPNLQNPWGAAWAPGGPLWTSDNNNGLSTLYSGTAPFTQALVVTLPITAIDTTLAQTVSNPDGIIWNPNGGQFVFNANGAVSATNTATPSAGAIFIFVGEDGGIWAWNPAVDPITVAGGKVTSTATLVKDNSLINGKPGAVYKGLAYGTNVHGNFIFATNFRAGKVEAYDAKFNLTTLDGNFTDPNIPANFAPFGIANIDGALFVTYAEQDPATNNHDPVVGDGLGFVDVFSTDGVFVRRFASRGVLNAPWGVVRAPESFGSKAGDVLIGNFGNNGHFGGWINAFGNHGEFLGELRSPQGKPISIDGLWSLYFGSFLGSDGGTLYFTAGPNNQLDGIFGQITAVRPADADMTP
jgi:uncharacterized protein (TIGR03118 family)